MTDRVCSYCGCKTNAAIRACCLAGRVEDREAARIRQAAAAVAALIEAPADRPDASPKTGSTKS
jgi:hypothetical protein